MGFAPDAIWYEHYKVQLDGQKTSKFDWITLLGYIRDVYYRPIWIRRQNAKPFPKITSAFRETRNAAPIDYTEA